MTRLLEGCRGAGRPGRGGEIAHGPARGGPACWRGPLAGSRGTPALLALPAACRGALAPYVPPPERPACPSPRPAQQELFAGEAALAAAVGLNSADDNLPYSTAELNAPEYSTDDFRMFSFKVRRAVRRGRGAACDAMPHGPRRTHCAAAHPPTLPPSSRRWHAAASATCTTGGRARLRTPPRTRAAATRACTSTCRCPARSTSAGSASGGRGMCRVGGGGADWGLLGWLGAGGSVAGGRSAPGRRLPSPTAAPPPSDLACPAAGRRGDTCPYSHGVYECWLHPAKYRTQLCKEGPHCRRPVCFFAHSVLDLRQPTHVWDGNTFEVRGAAGAGAGRAAGGAQAGSCCAGWATPQLVGCAFQCAVQQPRPPQHSSAL